MAGEKLLAPTPPEGPVEVFAAMGASGQHPLIAMAAMMAGHVEMRPAPAAHIGAAGIQVIAFGAQCASFDPRVSRNVL
jgi:hypothetical protein